MLKFPFSMNDNTRALVAFLVFAIVIGASFSILRSLGECSSGPCFTFNTLYISFLLTFLLDLLSFLSGWLFLWLDNKPSRQPERWSSLQSGMVGWCRFNNAFRVSATEDGLYLTGLWIIRFTFPTVCIPWEKIQFQKHYEFLFGSFVVYRVQTRFGPVSIHLNQTLEDSIHAAQSHPDSPKPA